MRVTNKAAIGLSLGAIGVVFGDIGTSPLYALQAVFGRFGQHLAVTELNVYGIISLVSWAILLIVSVKYVGFIMRVDNRGEGGIMALTALLQTKQRSVPGRAIYIFLGLIGVALFYGDSSITPAISVLSAVEGLKSVSLEFDKLVVPLTILLLTLLFWVQQYGTGFIGRIFGPVMLAWFVVIGVAGGWQIWQQPSALMALSPVSAIHFITAEPLIAFISLGAVVLAITGAEALYADMGHFGRAPISRSWFGLVFPALVLCYVGQGAALLSGVAPGTTPFMALFPANNLRILVVILATAATLIASQSVISGAFSLTRQAVQLGFLPKLRIIHTSVHEAGQIYLPFINTVLFIAVAVLVVGFGSSERLSHAYGIAVSGTLLIDTVLFLAVALAVLHRSVVLMIGIGSVFVAIDLLFVGANISKVMSGGWFPLLLSAVVLVILRTWIRGQEIVRAERRALEGPLQDFVDKIHHAKPVIARVPGCAVYIAHHVDLAPLALHATVEKLHELHAKVVIVSVKIAAEAHIPDSKRAVFSNLAYDDGISHLILKYGFHDTPNVPRTLESVRKLSPELDFDPHEVSYFISLSKVIPGKRHNLAGWRKTLYCMMARNALSTSDYYRLPIERTIEMRTLIEL